MSEQQGKKTVTVGIGGDSYALVADFNAVAAIEGVFGKSVFEITQEALKQGITTNTNILFHAIRSNPANDAKSLKVSDVGAAVVADFGTDERALFRAVIEFLNEYYPKAKAVASKGKKTPAEQ